MEPAASRSRPLRWIVLGSAALAAAVGGGTALLVTSRLEPPGGPVVSGIDPGTLELEKENLLLKEDLKRVRGELAEARIHLAAMKAFPRENPAVAAGQAQDAESVRAQKEFEEAELRSKLDRAWKDAPPSEDAREAAVRILVEGAEKVRALSDRLSREGGDPDAYRREAETVGRDTRRRLLGVLTEGQVRSVDAVLSGDGPGGERK